MQKQQELQCRAFITHSLYAAPYFLFANVCYSSNGIQHILHPFVLTTSVIYHPWDLAVVIPRYWKQTLIYYKTITNKNPKEQTYPKTSRHPQPQTTPCVYANTYNSTTTIKTSSPQESAVSVHIFQLQTHIAPRWIEFELTRLHYLT